MPTLKRAVPVNGSPSHCLIASDYHVAGDAMTMTTLHPQSNWAFRPTLDVSGLGNWTNILPKMTEYGLSSFCEPSIAVLASWVGSQGVVQII